MVDHKLAERFYLPRSALLAYIARLCEGDDKKRIMQQISRGAAGQHPHDRLSAAESVCVVRLARIVATAEYVWSSRNDAKEFLNHEHPMLEGKSPVEIAQTEIGARRVENLLWHIFYGVVS